MSAEGPSPANECAVPCAHSQYRSVTDIGRIAAHSALTQNGCQTRTQKHVTGGSVMWLGFGWSERREWLQQRSFEQVSLA
jgi:hypothetical protein